MGEASLKNKEAPQSCLHKNSLLFFNLGFLNKRAGKGIIQVLHSKEKPVAKVLSTLADKQNTLTHT